MTVRPAGRMRICGAAGGQQAGNDRRGLPGTTAGKGKHERHDNAPT